MVGQVVLRIEDDVGLDLGGDGLVQEWHGEGLGLLNVTGVAQGILGVLWEATVAHGSNEIPLETVCTNKLSLINKS